MNYNSIIIKNFMKGTEHIMVFKTKNELGLISIKDTAIKTIAGHVASTCYGVVGLADRKTKQSIFSFTDNSYNSAIKVSYNGGLIIEIHIYVIYGMNIQTISNNILESLSYILSDSFGLKVNKVNVHVDGIKM